MRRGRSDRGDDGAAVVEFVMMSGLLIFLLFAVLQVAAYFYARNIVAASAAAAARYAADAGVDPRDGGPRARQLIADGLNTATATSVPCTGRASTDAASGLATVTVRCHGQFALLLVPLHVPLGIDVSASVLRETAP